MVPHGASYSVFWNPNVDVHGYINCIQVCVFQNVPPLNPYIVENSTCRHYFARSFWLGPKATVEGMKPLFQNAKCLLNRDSEMLLKNLHAAINKIFKEKCNNALLSYSTIHDCTCNTTRMCLIEVAII